MTDKFCINCKFCSEDGILYYCDNPNNGTNNVTGQIKSKFAAATRGSEFQCGINGKWYEPKKGDNSKLSLWDKIKLICRYKQEN